MEQRDLILIQGISGSGKTTEAKKWVEEDPIHRIRLNYDVRKILGSRKGTLNEKYF